MAHYKLISKHLGQQDYGLGRIRELICTGSATIKLSMSRYWHGLVAWLTGGMEYS